MTTPIIVTIILCSLIVEKFFRENGKLGMELLYLTDIARAHAGSCCFRHVVVHRVVEKSGKQPSSAYQRAKWSLLRRH
jgi:hypothetical protein